MISSWSGSFLIARSFAVASLNAERFLDDQKLTALVLFFVFVH
ncbi:MAG TPA: hypothetical protein PKJ30_12500 [Leptospiraceae bacterium]|nr:hypothetical protein [Leptospiraceae bacterium]